MSEEPDFTTKEGKLMSIASNTQECFTKLLELAKAQEDLRLAVELAGELDTTEGEDN